jgi:hypothetical protein
VPQRSYDSIVLNALHFVWRLSSPALYSEFAGLTTMISANRSFHVLTGVNERYGDITSTVVPSNQSSRIKDSQDSDNGDEQPR